MKKIERFIREKFNSLKTIREKWCGLVEVKCPECDATMNIPDDAVSGEIVSCLDCGMDFEVTGVGNGELMLKPAEIEGEDWGE